MRAEQLTFLNHHRYRGRFWACKTDLSSPMINTNATLTLLRINGESHQKFIHISIAKGPGEFHEFFLDLRRTRRMYGVSVTYV